MRTRVSQFLVELNTELKIIQPFKESHYIHPDHACTIKGSEWKVK